MIARRYSLSCYLTVIAWLVLSPLSVSAAVSVVDDQQQLVTLDHPARRIMAISPHLAEMVHAVGAGDRLIATVRGADYPPEVLAVPTVGDASGLDFERMLQLEPDLILAWGSGNRAIDVQRLAGSGAALYVAEARSLSDIGRHLREIGQLSGTDDLAERAAITYENQLQQLRGSYAHLSTVRVFVEIWHRPVFTINAEHILTDVLHSCGGRNVLADYPRLAGPVPLENILLVRPQVILSLTGMDAKANGDRWHSMLPSTERDSVTVITLAADLLTRATPRVLDGSRKLCERLNDVRHAAHHSQPGH